MTAYIGIDPSLQSTGVARLWPMELRRSSDETWSVRTGAITSEPEGKATEMTLAQRYQRIQKITAGLRSWLVPGDQLVIERMFNSRGAGTVERAWLWGTAVGASVDLGVSIVELPPMSRAMFACGHGGADKAAVALAASRMWPTWTPATDKNVNDEADALVLASIAAALAGAPVPFEITAYRQHVLDKIRKAK